MRLATDAEKSESVQAGVGGDSCPLTPGRSYRHISNLKTGATGKSHQDSQPKKGLQRAR